MSLSKEAQTVIDAVALLKGGPGSGPHKRSAEYEAANAAAAKAGIHADGSGKVADHRAAREAHRAARKLSDAAGDKERSAHHTEELAHHHRATGDR